MKKVDRWAALTAALLLTVSLAPASQAAEAGEKIVILHTNDVHCALDDAIGYAGLAAYAGALEEQYGADRVTMVDAGDAVQGGPIGTLTQGEYLVDIMNQVGYDTVQAREQALVHYAMSRMVELPYVEIIGSIYWDRHHGVISFNVRGVHPHDVASILDMQGVCIRAGHHCAQPLLTWLGVENLACCRASLAFYNDKHDVDAFIDGLETVYRTFN